MMRRLGFFVLVLSLACGPGVDSQVGEETGGARAPQAPTAKVPAGRTPAATGVEPQATPQTATGQPVQPAPAAAGAAADAVAVSVPEGNLRGDAAKGAQLYALYCTSCHGPTGAGDGPLAATLVPPPANHTDTVYMESLTDEHLYKVIQGGGAAVGKSPLMAPWGAVVSEDQTRDLIAHLRALSGT